MFKGFQNLTQTQKAAAARIAALGGHDFFGASHIWFFDTTQTLMLRLPSGVDVLIAPTYKDS